MGQFLDLHQRPSDDGSDPLHRTDVCMHRSGHPSDHVFFGNQSEQIEQLNPSTNPLSTEDREGTDEQAPLLVFFHLLKTKCSPRQHLGSRIGVDVTDH